METDWKPTTPAGEIIPDEAWVSSSAELVGEIIRLRDALWTAERQVDAGDDDGALQTIRDALHSPQELRDALNAAEREAERLGNALEEIRNRWPRAEPYESDADCAAAMREIARAAVEDRGVKGDEFEGALIWLWAHLPFWTATSLRAVIERFVPDAFERYTALDPEAQEALASGPPGGEGTDET